MSKILNRSAPRSWIAVRLVSITLVSIVLTACGGGGGGGGSSSQPPVAPPVTPPPVTPPATVAPTTTQVSLQSDAGDAIGLGRAYSYSMANASIQVTLQGGRLSVVATGNEDWQGDFQIPSNVTPVAARYDTVPRYPQSDTTRPAMRWFGGGRGCATSTGWFAIDQISLFADGNLSSLILRFERQCDGSTAALRGEVRWLAGDPTKPPAVALPAPANLWQPPVGATPTTGNYVYVQSEAGDYVGQGRSALYTPRDAGFFGSGGFDFFEVSVTGAQRWYGIIQGRRETAKLQPGYYAELTRYPFINPVRGGLSWVSDGRGCTDQRGWMVIDEIVYATDAPSVLKIAYRFEQRCIESAAVLRGAVRWSAADAAPPTMPSPSLAPATWQPPSSGLPASGTLIYVDGEPGDGVERGVERLFTPLDAVISLEESTGLVVIRIDGLRWQAQLRTEPSPAPLRPGVFAGLPRGFSPINDDQPHFSWTGQGSGCESSLAWVAVDAAVYTAGRLTALDLRFEQRCSGAVGATRGLVRWRADDLRAPSGPQAIIPKAAWRPLTGEVPAAGSYLLINSSRYDNVGAGLHALYNQANAKFEPSAQGNELTWRILGDDTWRMVFKGIEGQPRLTPGTYAAVSRWPFHSPARGGMDVTRSGAPGGNSLQGNFIIDSIEYSTQGQLSALQMRFEQHVEGSTPGAVWGELRWSASDPIQPTGPVIPLPTGLWAPPAGATPSIGSYLYFESSTDDFIGAGQTRIFTSPAARFSAVPGRLNSAGAVEAALTTDAGGAFPWELQLSPMFNLPRLQAGYYAVPFGFSFQNPAKGGLSFRGDGRGCNQVGGWFAIDSITYDGNSISSVKVRFEQVCEGRGSLRGEFVLKP